MGKTITGCGLTGKRSKSERCWRASSYQVVISLKYPKTGVSKCRSVRLKQALFDELTAEP
jgi:hypothetical protein